METIYMDMYQENYIKIYDEVEDRFMAVRNAYDGQELIKKLKSIGK